ncbi:MAG TPA: hypothetical protein VMO78_03200 [Rhizomicrobium sp.]|jgi:hypothetical protein|nr:hypothetical protein [Rhizomicrobium sp.]
MASKYFKAIMPWLLLGPLTGPLAEGVVRNWRSGEVLLSCLYGIAFSLTTFDLYALGVQLVVSTPGFGLFG